MSTRANIRNEHKKSKTQKCVVEMKEIKLTKHDPYTFSH